MGDSVKGRSIASCIGVYMILKSVINLVIGFSVNNIVTLLVCVAFAYGLRTGKKYFNYITAVFLAAIALYHLKGNIDGRQWLYLIEGIADIVCAAILVISKDIRGYFS